MGDTVHSCVYGVKRTVRELRQAYRFARAYLVGGDGQVARELANLLAAATLRGPGGNASQAARPVGHHKRSLFGR